MTLPPELEAQARELARQSAHLHVIRPRPSEQEFMDALREMAQRTLGWAATSLHSHCRAIIDNPNHASNGVRECYAGLRSLSGDDYFTKAALEVVDSNERAESAERELKALRQERDKLRKQLYADDGFGNVWGPCPDCGSRLDVMRPGKATCSVCETRRVFYELLEERNTLRGELKVLREQMQKAIDIIPASMGGHVTIGLNILQAALRRGPEGGK